VLGGLHHEYGLVKEGCLATDLIFAECGSFQSAWRTLQGIETVHMIRKGRARWLANDDVLGQALFITDLFGIAA
jgi:hypothetical protein